MHQSNNTAQLLDVDGETAGAIIPRWLWTQSDDASTMLRTLQNTVLSCSRANSARAASGEVSQSTSLSVDVSGARLPPSCLSAGGGAAAAGRAERLHLLWSHCVWLTVRGQGVKSVHSEWVGSYTSWGKWQHGRLCDSFTNGSFFSYLASVEKMPDRITTGVINTLKALNGAAIFQSI